LTYEEFQEALRQKIIKELHFEDESIKFVPEGFTSDDPKIIQGIIETNQKFSGQASPYLLKDFFIIEKDFKGNSDVKIAQRVDLKAMYELEQKKGLDAVFYEIRKAFEEIDKSGVSPEKILQRDTLNYEDLRDQLIIRPLNYKLYMAELGDYVYRRTADVAFVLYHLLNYSKEAGISSIKIRREDLFRWNMNDRIEEVMKNALENTAKIFPAVVYNFKLNKQLDFLNDEFTREDLLNELIPGAFILSTKATTNGALALFYPGVCEKLLKIMDGPFAAVLMNINDVMIVKPKDPHIDKLLDGARHSGKMGEMLSTRLFIGNEKGINPA